MNWITDHVAIGNIDDAMDIPKLRKRGISAILCLTYFPTYFSNPDFPWHRVYLTDGAGNTLDDLRQAVETLVDLAQRGKILVHCSEGASRAPLVVACYLMQQERITLEEGLARVKARRKTASVDPNLLRLGYQFQELVFDHQGQDPTRGPGLASS